MNRTSADAYTPGNLVEQRGARRVVLTVANAAILYQLGHGHPGIVYGPDESLALPGVYGLDRQCDGLRFRSLAAGAPAQVSVELVPAGEYVGGGRA